MRYQLNANNYLYSILLQMIKTFIVPNSWMDERLDNSGVSFPTRNLLYQHWAANGYVAVDKSYKCYGKNYNDLCYSYDRKDKSLDKYETINVHGWLTFGEHLSTCWGHIKKVYLELPGTTEDDDVWIFGFDTNHYWDKQSEWTIEKVKEETEGLAKQMEQYLK